MNLKVNRYNLKIEDGTFWKDINVAFIEEVLGLKNDGDSIRLVRKNASGLSCIAYLETMKEEEYKKYIKNINDKLVNDISDKYSESKDISSKCEKQKCDIGCINYVDYDGSCSINKLRENLNISSISMVANDEGKVSYEPTGKFIKNLSDNIQEELKHNELLEQQSIAAARRDDNFSD